MLIIPELETVVILTPRTGTRTLINATSVLYPKTIMLYRHMEADGVPTGYDRWRRVGLVRPPLARLWSLYKFLGLMGRREHYGADRKSGDWFKTNNPKHDEGFFDYVAAQAAMPFEEWLLTNERPFTNQYSRVDPTETIPQFTVLHSLPENRKSQFVYLRPDLGTEVFDFRDMAGFMRDVMKANYAKRHNVSPKEAEMPEPTPAMYDHLQRYMPWDVAKTQAFV